MKKRILSLILCLALCLTLSVSAFAADTSDTGYTSEELYEKYQVIKEIYNMYELDGASSSEMLDSVMKQILATNPELFEEIMNAMVKSHEKYSGYYSAETYAKGFPSVSYYGIGVGVSVDESDYITVQDVYSGPAKTAGILAGDRILKVNEADVAYASIEEAGELIRGEEGTTVTITVFRPSENKTIAYDVVRGPVNTSAVTCVMITDDVAYVYLEHFNGINVFIDFCVMQEELNKKGVEKVIIDVRGNLGGDGDVVLNILNQMIEKEDVVITNFRTNSTNSSFKSTGAGTAFKNLVVLADTTSYSSAEIFAGVVKDLKLGFLVGTTTAGKGVGQEHIEFKDGSVVAITTSEVVLPVTGAYHGKGITPDIRVSNELRKPEISEPLTRLDYTSQIHPGDEESSVIKAVEERLNVLGYLSNVPDENYDLRAQNAVKAYQKAHGVSQDGYISATLVRWLEEDIETYLNTPVLYDTQLDAALEILK